MINRTADNFYIIDTCYYGNVQPRTGHENPGGGDVRAELYYFFNLGARWGWVGKATPRPL
jgi:hypothetical protein